MYNDQKSRGFNGDTKKLGSFINRLAVREVESQNLRLQNHVFVGIQFFGIFGVLWGTWNPSLGYFGVLSGILGYFWVILGNFGYFWVLLGTLGTLGTFGVLLGTFGYLGVLRGT